jgi:hypothetical protein
VGDYKAEEYDDQRKVWSGHDGLHIYISVDVCIFPSIVLLDWIQFRPIPLPPSLISPRAISYHTYITEPNIPPSLPSNPLKSPLTSLSLQEVFDKDHRVVSQKGAASGKFTFTADGSGEHKICFTPSSTSGGSGWLNALSHMGGIKLKLDLAIGESSALDAADKGKIHDIVQKVKDLNGRLQDIRREQVFQRVCCDMFFYLFIFYSFLEGRRRFHPSSRPWTSSIPTFILTTSSSHPTGARGRIQRPIGIDQRASRAMDACPASRFGYHLCLAAISPTVVLHQAEVNIERGMCIGDEERNRGCKFCNDMNLAKKI